MTSLTYLFLIPLMAAAIAFCSSVLPIKKNLKDLSVGMGCIPLFFLMARHHQWMGEEIDYNWFPALSIHIHFGMDALSLLFVYLAALIIPIALLAVPRQEIVYPSIFYGLIFILQGLLFGFFTARDLALFTILWESLLLPLYFIINLWGGPQKQMAGLKFLIYMIAGSTLMVAAVLFLYSASKEASTVTFDIAALSKIASTLPQAPWLCAIFLLAFAVKTPLFPFHAWLPDAYCQAPTAGTILLAGLISKVGIYGILRIAIPFFPTLMKEWNPFLLGFAIAGLFYGGLAAWMQRDYKRLIAYSSFSHVNFILIGLFVGNEMAQAGALLQVLNHAVTITALFLVASWLENRVGSTFIGEVSGLAKYFPQLCWITLFFVLASVALPGTNNFVGELMIFYGLFSINGWLSALVGLTIILSVIYMLRWMQKIYFEIPSEIAACDIKGREIAIALPLMLLVLWIGIYPSPVLNHIQSVTEKVEESPL